MDDRVAALDVVADEHLAVEVALDKLGAGLGEVLGPGRVADQRRTVHVGADDVALVAALEAVAVAEPDHGLGQRADTGAEVGDALVVLETGDAGYPERGVHVATAGDHEPGAVVQPLELGAEPVVRRNDAPDLARLSSYASRSYASATSIFVERIIDSM